MATSKYSVIESFTKLSSCVSIYTPPTISTSNASSTAPTTILICTWMGGLSKHYGKYISEHMRRHPHARIIVVTTQFAEFMFQSETTRRAEILPGVSALLTAGVDSSSKERILVHVFSNGGGKRLYGFAAEYKRLTGSVMPVKALILDSAPGGIPRMKQDIHVLMQTAPQNPLLYAMIWPVGFLAAAMVWVTINVLRYDEMATNPRRAVNDPTQMSAQAVRAYIFSKEDKVVLWKDIVSSAEEGKAKGYKVLLEEFKGTAHVGHMRLEETRYWKVVETAWRLGSEN